MESQIAVLYEVVESITNKTFTTKDYNIAVDHFNDGHMVFEHHITTCNPEEYL